MDIHVQYYKQLFSYPIQQVKELIAVGDSCAIVGNSGILNDSGHGKDIDSHDYVVRFNAAPTEGYEKDVGERTTHRFLNVLMQRGGSLDHTTNTPKHFIEEIEDEVVFLKSTRNSIQDRAKARISQSCDILPIVNSYQRFYKEVIKKYLDNSYRTGNLSLGIQGALIFLPLVNKLDLYGFTAYSDNDISKYHYWEDFTKDITGPHDYNRELNILEELDEIYGVTVHR